MSSRIFAKTDFSLNLAKRTSVPILIGQNALYEGGCEMVDPDSIQNVMVATLYGAGVVLCGAGYAIFLALARLDGMASKQRLFTWTALIWYVFLVLSVVGLVQTLQLRGWWLGLAALMLIGYFAAPRFIWKLSHEMHSKE